MIAGLSRTLGSGTRSASHAKYDRVKVFEGIFSRCEGVHRFRVSLNGHRGAAVLRVPSAAVRVARLSRTKGAGYTGEQAAPERLSARTVRSVSAGRAHGAACGFVATILCWGSITCDLSLRNFSCAEQSARRLGLPRGRRCLFKLETCRCRAAASAAASRRPTLDSAQTAERRGLLT